MAGTATLDITPVNDAPATTAVTLAAIAEDSGARLITQAQLLGNAGDIEGDALVASNLAITGGNGSLVDNGNGTWTYTPAANDDASVSFSYTITDNGTTNGNADPKSVAGTATLDITPVNDAPATTAVTLAAIAEDSGARLITQAQLLGNAVDIEGNGLVASNLAINAGNGTLVNNGNGTWTYTPAANDDASVSFSYTITDNGTTNGSADPKSVAGTATLDITPVNDAPATTAVTLAAIAEDSGARLITQAQLLGNAGDIEGDALVASNLAITGGNGSLVDNGNGTWTYTPAANDNGVVAFAYTITDNGTTDGNADPKSVAGSATLAITSVNDAPALPDSALALFQDSPWVGRLPAATDADGDTLQYALAQAPAHGTVTLGADGQYRYVPAAGYSGADRFQVSVSDGQGGLTLAWVDMNVMPLPSISLPAAFDTGASDRDLHTELGVVTLAGSAAPGQTLRLYSPAGALLATTVADANGRWSVPDVDLMALTGDAAGAAPGALGPYTFSVRAVAADGQLSAAAPLTVVRESVPAVLPAPVAPAPAEAPSSAPAAPVAFEPVAALTDGGPGWLLYTEPPPDAQRLPPQGPPALDSNVGDIYTRPSGFQIMVNPAPEPSLRLFRGLDDQVVKPGTALNLQVPADTFIHTNINETVMLQATLANGQPLPGWLRFDGKAGTLAGELPDEWRQDVVIRIVARDSQGREATAMMRIKLSDLQRGRSGGGLSLQLLRSGAPARAALVRG
ncbi:hypothetical protein RA210_U230001 [Rubrivivax sp. A210]|nr:hypothetical protein RA210_U230001 [Rubrivivax sp. A210]